MYEALIQQAIIAAILFAAFALKHKIWFIVRAIWNKIHPWSLAKVDAWWWERNSND